MGTECINSISRHAYANAAFDEHLCPAADTVHHSETAVALYKNSESPHADCHLIDGILIGQDGVAP